MSSLSESVSTNPSPKLSLSSISSIQTSNDGLSLLWDQAVEEYILHARLTKKEKEFLEMFHTPEEAFDLTRHGWQMNNHKKRWRGHETAKTMLSQVLAVFDLLAAAACSGFPPCSVVCGAIKLLLQTARNLWNVYTLIEQQFLAIEGFFVSIKINLEARDVPDGLHRILVKILVQILKICGIATGYAKTTSFFKRVTENCLKSLGPNDKLNDAVSELNILLRAEQAIIIAQINERTGDTRRLAKDSLITVIKINDRTEDIHEGIQQTRKLSGQMNRRTSDMQEDIRQTSLVARNIDQRTMEFLHAMDRMEAMSVSSQSSIEHLKENLKSLHPKEEVKSSLDEELSELRTWLDPLPNYEEDYLHNSKLRGENTCNWAFSASDTVGRAILPWLKARDKEHAVIWLTGQPAQGKSVLAAYLIEHCEHKYGDCLYFFCRHDNEAKRSVSRVLRTVAFHLAEMKQVVRRNYVAQKRQGISLTDMSLRMLWERLFRGHFTYGLSQRLHWVIDGFDELHPSDRREFASLLFEVKNYNIDIRILIIGREEHEIEEAIGSSGIKVVKIERNHTIMDIRTVVTRQVRSKLSALSSDSQKAVVDTLTKKAGVLFLWAQLALDIICKKRREKAIFEALEYLPLDYQMTSLYSIIVGRILSICSDDDDKEMAKALLTWTLCSFRPLSVSELQFAIELEFGSIISFEKTIRDFSGSLLEIGETKLVTALHLTVKEFFLNDQAGELRVSEDDGHRSLARLCMNYLAGNVGKLPRYLHAEENSKSAPEALTQRHPFLRYSSRYLFNHIKLAKMAGNNFMSEVLGFLESRRSLTWIEALGAFGEVNTLLIAADALVSLGSHPQALAQSSQMSVDLSRIALQIEEKVTQHPRSIHTSLSSMFPSSCRIGAEARGMGASCLQPRLLIWPAWRAFRGGDSLPENVRLCFTPCGEYLVYGQKTKQHRPVDITIYQTQTYRPVLRLPPFIYEENKLERGIALRGSSTFFEVQCGWSSQFRVVIAFATGRVPLGGQMYSKCILAEHVTNTPYQLHEGTWRQISVKFPISRNSPTMRIVLNPNGRQILAWSGPHLYTWRDIGSLVTTSECAGSIYAAGFAVINDMTVILCVLPQGLRLFDHSGHSLCVISYDFGRISDAIFDSHDQKVLIAAPERGKYQMVRVEFRSNRYQITTLEHKSIDIRRYSGFLGADRWNYAVWVSSGHRRLITSHSTKILYPHPINDESVVPSLPKGHRFTVFDDLPYTPSSPTSRAKRNMSPQVVEWQKLLQNEECANNRVWLHEHNYKISPCGSYIAFFGCDGTFHLPDCEQCVLEPSRLGFGDRSTKHPSIWWPGDEETELNEGTTDVRFDQFSQLFIFTDLGGGSTTVRTVNPKNGKTKEVGSLHLGQFSIPPAIFAETLDTIYFVCYSPTSAMEVWKLDPEHPRDEIHFEKQIDEIYAITADMHGSTLIFVTTSGWLCTLELDEWERPRYHYWLPSQLLVSDEGKDQCKLSYTGNGVVTLWDMYNEQWIFEVESLRRVLES